MYRYRFGQLRRHRTRGFFALYVFEDALVEVPLGGSGTMMDRPGREIGAQGAAGGLVRGIKVAGRINDRKQAAEAAGQQAVQGQQMASAIAGAELLPLAEIAEIRLEKALLKARTMIIRTAGSAERRYGYTEPAHPAGILADLFGSLLGDRFTCGLM
jgi:hypothetical protein